MNRRRRTELRRCARGVIVAAHTSSTRLRQSSRRLRLRLRAPAPGRSCGITNRHSNQK